MARQIEDYLALIPSANRGKPKFVETVSLVLQPLCEAQALLEDLPSYFDIDDAIGVQLDKVGEWVGQSRYILIPLDTPWFAWDTDSRGWDEGIWKGPISPTTGISPLNDETYRNLLRAIVGANAWDGTVETGAAILNIFYQSQGVSVLLEDKQDMTLNIVASGTPSVLVLSIMNWQYIRIKPAGVLTKYIVSSVPSSPVFGFDISNDVIGGWDVGAWGVTPADIINGTI